MGNALERFRSEGFDADGTVGDADPAAAAIEAWDPRRYDEVIVSTLPIGVSRWLQAGIPSRIARVTGALVTHVISQPPKPVLRAARAGGVNLDSPPAVGR